MLFDREALKQIIRQKESWTRDELERLLESGAMSLASG